jgi:hypothetical protein
MRFDRRAGGHNFDFDTDVCTRCGIDRRQYRDGGNPECAPHHMDPLMTTATWQMPCQVHPPVTTLQPGRYWSLVVRWVTNEKLTASMPPVGFSRVIRQRNAASIAASTGTASFA